MAKARTVASGVLQHTSAQASAFTQQLRSGRTSAAPDPAVELEDSSWAPHWPAEGPALKTHTHSANADADAGAAVLSGTPLAESGSPHASDGMAAAAEERDGRFDVSAGPARSPSPLLPSGASSPPRLAGAFRRPPSSADLSPSFERQLSQRRSSECMHVHATVLSGDVSPFSQDVPERMQQALSGEPVVRVDQGADPAQQASMSILVCAAEVVPGTSRGQHGEFPIVTTAGGREFRVVRRFRQVRKLQQQLRGSYGGGNLDLFLPAAGALRMPRLLCCALVNACERGPPDLSLSRTHV